MFSIGSEIRNPENEFRVVISGAGPAGISTWLHLQKFAPQIARNSLLIDKAVFPRDKLCAGGVGGWSHMVLKLLGIDLDVPSVAVSDLEFRFENEVYLHHQPDLFQVVSRREFDHALVKTAIRRGLILHEDEKFIDATRDNNRLLIKTSKATYRARILVGADGALSMVRRKMLPLQKPHLARTIQIFAPVDPRYDPEYNQKKIVWNFTPVKDGLQGYVYHFPCLINDVPSMAHGVGDVRIHAHKPRADLKKIFSRALRSRGIPNEPRSWCSHPIRWLAMEDVISQPNILLVGDAAGIEPAFGGGIHLSLSYGQVAASAIVEAFQKNDFSFHDYQKKMQSHLVGTHIQDCLRTARDMYGGIANPLVIAREFFTRKLNDPYLVFHFLAGALQVHVNSGSDHSGKGEI